MAETVVPAKKLGPLTRWWVTRTWGAAGWQRCLTAAIAALVLWAQSSVDAVVGLDPSWEAGLALARIQNLRWGPEIVFTYGPLGFLQTSAYYSFEQSVLASVYQLAVMAALFLGIAEALRQRHSPVTSLVIAFVTTGITAIVHVGTGGFPGLRYPELAALAAFAWAAVPLLQHDPKRSTVFTTCVVLASFGALQLLVKFNTGLAIIVTALAVSVLHDWKALGRHCATVMTFAACVLVSWVLAGQRPEDLPVWLKSSTAFMSGYAAMTNPLPAFAMQPLVCSGVWFGALCVMFVWGGPQIPRRFIALIGLTTVIAARNAFGHFDVVHLWYLLGVVVVAVVITPLSGLRGRAFEAVVIAVVVAAIAVDPDVDYRIGAVLQAPAQATDRLVTLALPGHLNQHIEQAKARQRARYDIPGRFIEIIGHGSVHIDPTETSAAWAYDLTWRPAPVFQTYAAYTPNLDQLDSDSLARGPEFVLSRRSPASPSIDMQGRLGVQESPGSSRALLCNYTVGGNENRWALLTHTGSRCGPLTALPPVDIHGSGAVPVPVPSGPDMAVLVGIDLQPTLVDRLFQGTLAPLTTCTVIVDGVAYRLVTENAAEPFLLNTPASVDHTNLEIHADTIGLGRTRSLGQGNIIARLRFYEMRVAP